MTTDAPKPPPFYCPACGHKHRADLGRLAAQTGAIARLDCQRCGVGMALTIGADGLPKCEVRSAADTPSADVAPARPTTLPADRPGGAMSRSPIALALAAAVVVAAGVSFAVMTLAGPTSAPERDDGRIAALERRLADTQARLEAAIARAEAAGREAVGPLQTELRATCASLQEGLGAQVRTVAGLEQIQRQTSEGLTEVRDQVKGLSGRIEANYQKGRELAKRIEALEGD